MADAAVDDVQTRGQAKELSPEEAAERMLPKISPQEMLAAVETPGAFKEIAKADLFMEMARLRRLFKSGSISIADRLKYLQQLARMAGADTAPADGNASSMAANIPQINIVVNGQPVINAQQSDGKAERV